MSDRPLICGFMKVRNEVIREGNIYRALRNLEQFCDVIVACDDASNDETGRILREHPKVVVCLDVPREEQDFRNELAVKQTMLQEVHKLQPYFVWWHDADEELDAEGVAGIRGLCESLKDGGPPAWRFVYKQLWRSPNWFRTDSGFGEGAFIKLWRWRPDLSFEVSYGTHRHQFPRQIAEALHLVPQAPWAVIHWGNYGKNLEWKCIQYYGGLGGVDRHLIFDHAEYEALDQGSALNGPKPVPFTDQEKEYILSMTGLRRTPGWFTVLVPTYNRMAGNKLLLALQSLLDQTYPHWIALVLDDGSTDDTATRIREWTERDPRIFYCRYEQNRGGVAMNEIGTNLAIEFTEFWTRLGSDDYFDPNKLELDAWAFAQGADAVYGPYQVLRFGGRGETCNPPNRPSVTQAALFNGVFAASWANVAIRCTALERVRQIWGKFADPRLRNMEDFLVNARVGQVTDGFHFRGMVDGVRTFVRSDADADALGDPRAFLTSHRAKADAVWNVGIDGASSNMGVTAKDDALTRIILQEDRERSIAIPPLPAPTKGGGVQRVTIGSPVPPSPPPVFGITPPAATRAFWRCAGGFPKDKEAAYPGHAEAHQFDRHRGQDVLEYGCGGGADALSWARRECRVIAADIVPENVAITRQALTDAGPNYGDATLLQYTTPLPFSDGRFDVVSSHGVVHHITAPACNYLMREFFRVLRPGGTIYLMLYTEHLWKYHWPDMQVHVQTKGLTKEEAFGWCTDGNGCPYARAYTEEEGRVFLEAAGFQLEGVVDYNTMFFRTFQARRP